MGILDWLFGPSDPDAKKVAKSIPPSYPSDQVHHSGSDRNALNNPNLHTEKRGKEAHAELLKFFRGGGDD